MLQESILRVAMRASQRSRDEMTAVIETARVAWKRGKGRKAKAKKSAAKKKK